MLEFAETRVSLNLNVLDAKGAPRVMSLREALQAYLDHRREVLVRRSKKRLQEIERRLEILGGYLIAYLNIDEVIRIIREEDEPKPVMMKKFGLTDTQAEAILNMRLRSCAAWKSSRSRRKTISSTKSAPRSRRCWAPSAANGLLCPAN